MDQGILEALKKRYKKRLLQHLILENDSSFLSVPEIVKKLTIKDSVAQAWEEATAESLAKSWKKLLVPTKSAPGSTPTQALTPSATAQAITPSASAQASTPSVTAQAMTPSAAQASTPSVTALTPSVTAQASTPSASAQGSTSSTTEAEGLTEFDDLFKELGYTCEDNWLSPQDWLEQDASNPGYQIMDDCDYSTESR